MEEDYIILNRLLSKKKISYSEFNELIGNYFIEEYEELEDNYYLIKVIRPTNGLNKSYLDYVEIVK